MNQKKQAAEALASKLAVSLVEVMPHGSFSSLTCLLPSELELLRGGKKTDDPAPAPAAQPNLEDEDPLVVFARENIRPGSLAMYPHEVKKVSSLYSALRFAVGKYYLCGKFVNVLFTDEILALADTIIADFNAQIKSMYDGWDDELKQFSDRSWEWLRSLSNISQEKRRQFHVKLLEQLPSKERFLRDSRLWLEIRPVPAPTNPVTSFSGKLNSLIEDGWQEQMLELGQAAVDNCLQSAFDCGNSILKSCLAGHDPSTPQRNRMASLYVTLRKNNLFSNQLIESIATIFERVTKNSSVGDDLEDEMSAILLSVWQYSKFSGGKAKIDMSKSVLSNDEFKSMDELQAAQKKLSGV